MPVTLNASTSSGLIATSDTSGNIELQANGVTRATVSSSGTTLPTATITTLNTLTGVLATQNGMTGIAKAWVNFNGTNGAVSGTPFNVSSVTRNSAGNYSINMTTALPNVNYSATIGASYLSGGTRYVNRLTGTFPTSTTVCTVLCNDYLGNSGDADSISVSIFSS